MNVVALQRERTVPGMRRSCASSAQRRSGLAGAARLADICCSMLGMWRGSPGGTGWHALCANLPCAA